MLFKLLTSIFLILLTSSLAIAESKSAAKSTSSVEAGSPAQMPPVTLSNTWVRLLPTPTTGAFAEFKNTSNQPLYIIGAQSEIAKKVEIHNHIHEGGVMKMREVKEIEIPANGLLQMKPGSYHIMLINTVRQLKEGEKVSIKVLLKDGSSLTSDFEVKKQ